MKENKSTTSKHLLALGSRIMCELNDIKRTPESAAKELNFDIEELKSIIAGTSTEERAGQLIERMGEVYPLDHTQMYLLKDDTSNGARFMSAEESKKRNRVYNRIDRDGNLTPYYEYRDTAMSKLSLLKPEWISQLRVVDNSDPYNPDVVLNNGHNMHQYGIFIGPVNFYWEDIQGNVQCTEMNTGDSNYITPFIKHSFTSRSENELAYIVACTSGGDVSRAQRELYALGDNAMENFVLDYRSNEATIQLIIQHMQNDMLSFRNMEELLRPYGLDIDIEKIVNKEREIKSEEYEAIAKVLNVELGDLKFPNYKPEDECVLTYISDNKPHSFPNDENKLYDIHTLARTSKMPLLRGSIIDVISANADINYPIHRSLHTYMINFGDSPVNLVWEYDGKVFENTVNPDDSVYLKPFVKCAFGNPSGGNARMFVVGISGSVTLQAQRELSSLADPVRAINELEPWFKT